jgi:hypothetical protein
VRVRILLLLCVGVMAAQPAARSPAPDRGAGRAFTGAETPFESRRPGEVIVPVTLAGRGPYRFLLDTGSTHSAVTSRVIAEIAAQPVARTTMTGAGGTVDCLVVGLPPVAIGSAVVDGLTATALPAASAAMLGAGVDGVLGQDFLARFSYSIDYRRSRVRWHEPDYVAPGLRLTLVPSEDRWLVELPQPGAGPVYRFVPDSGADTLLLYGDGLARRIVREWRADRATVDSLTGGRGVRTAIVDGLRIGDAILARQLAVVVPGARREPDGLLPLHLFASVQLNARHRYLVIQPR